MQKIIRKMPICIIVFFLLLLLGACSSLNRAASTNDIQLLEKTISEGKENIENNPYPLVIAAQKGHSEIVRVLLDAGAKPNLADLFNQTPLIWAASKNHPEIITMLLEAKADPEITENNFGQTALMVATITQHPKCAEILLKGGASPNTYDSNGATPLLEAVTAQHYVLVSKLLKSGADPNLTNKHGVSPLMFAANNHNTDILKELIDHNAKIDHKSNNGLDSLNFAVLANNYKAASILLEQGATPNTRSADGAFPLIAAAALNNPQMLSLLISNGADPNMQDNYGYTPLILASEKGYIDIVKVLLENGADPTFVKVNGLDALSVATSRNHKNISTLIRSALMRPVKTSLEQKPYSEEYNIYTGTGWLTQGGYIVTSNHVIDGNIDTRVRFNSKGSETYEAEVVLSDQHSNLAILQLNTPPTKFNVKGIPISSKMLNLGEDVFTIGYPKTSVMGRNAKVANGIISSLSGLHDDPRIIQTTVTIQRGNSGGPLLNMEGEVVGVTTATLSALVSKGGIDVPQNVNYAVKSDYVLALLSSLPQNNFPMTEPTNEKLETMVPKIKDSIVQIIVKSINNP